MSLTATKIRNIKPTQRIKKHFDANGLYLEVTPKGRKWWRMKYRHASKERRISLGVYPEITLKEARERRNEARRLLNQGIDPSQQRQAQKASIDALSETDFEGIAREWFKLNEPNWVHSHSDRIIRRLERDIFPFIGSTPITEITPPLLLVVLRRIQERGAIETAHRAMSNCGQVFRYAIATGQVERDPTNDLRGALQPVKNRHLAAVTEPADAAFVIKAIRSFRGTPVVEAALKFAPLVFVRPGELRHARWSDIDFETAEWRYLVTKTQTQHIVPLSTQAISILKDLHPITSRSEFVFPGARSQKRPMSDNAVLAAMRVVGIPKDMMTGHGFRAMARTILDEVLGFRPDIIEHQLAHMVRDPLGRAYNRTQHLEERKRMMQEWANYLESLTNGLD